VIAHELAHQWFGNLVTMEWWDDLWLNEGFASYTEYIGTNAVEPTWQMAFLQMYAYEYLDAMDLDALASTHPIEANVTDPAVVSQLFDSISYGKGASVIRMLQNYVDVKGGAGYFIQRINQYLSDEAYTNAVTSDLWAAMTSNVIPEVPDMMNSWTGQPGFPLLIVTQSGSTFSVSQERFLAIPAQWTPEMRAVFFTFSSSSSSSFLCNCCFTILSRLCPFAAIVADSRAVLNVSEHRGQHCPIHSFDDDPHSVTFPSHPRSWRLVQAQYGADCSFAGPVPLLQPPADQTELTAKC